MSTAESAVVLPEVVQRVSHLAQRRVGEETVVLDLERSRVYGFNAEAGELLEALKAPTATGNLNAPSPEHAARLRTFLAELIALELIEPGSPAGESVSESARAWVDPRLLWREDVARVTNQVSPPQAITNPQCQP
jgi:hypothetical protein